MDLGYEIVHRMKGQMGEAELPSDGELRGSSYSRPEQLRCTRPDADLADSGLSAPAGACARVSA